MSKSNKKFWLVIISLAILIILVSGSYFFFKSETYTKTFVDSDIGQVEVTLSENPQTTQAVTFSNSQINLGQPVTFTDSSNSGSSFGICSYTIDIKNGNTVKRFDDFFSSPKLSSQFSVTLSFTPTKVGTWTATTEYGLPSPLGECFGGYGGIVQGGTNSVNVVEQQQCNPNWQCGNWGTCVNNQQTRSCTDSNSCGTNSGKPPTTQSCTSSPGGCTQDVVQPCEDGTTVIISTCSNGQLTPTGNTCSPGTNPPNPPNPPEAPTDYGLYIIFGIATILLIVMIVVIVRRFKR